MMVGIRHDALVGVLDTRGLAMPEPARSFATLSSVVVYVGSPYTVEFQPIAEVLTVCRIGDKPRSPPAKPSQCFFPLGIDKENFLKIEGIAVALICRSSNTKEFLRP